VTSQFDGRARIWVLAILIATTTAVVSVASVSVGSGVVSVGSGFSRIPTASASAQARRQTIQHLTPARDSVGPAPSRFTWSPIKEAESYSIGVWNEVDVLLWRQNNIKEPSIVRPDDFPLEPGTYMWSVSALRQGEEIADSGLAAFVVRTAP
jgi:hypothetical protein